MTAPSGELAMASNCAAVLTPFPIPAALRGKKVENIGDGFILRAIERCLGAFAAERTLSPRVGLDAAQVAMLERAGLVILAGANQLHDRFSVWPGLTAAALRASRLRLVPFGIGLHGEAGHNERMSDATRELLVAIHERVPLSSWRCPDTIAYLQRELPQLADRLVLTGCPVVFDQPLLEGRPFTRGAARVAVTATERGEFEGRERAVLDFAATQFPRADRFLVVHQNWSPPTRWELLRHRWLPRRPQALDPFQRLRQYAVQRGYRIVVPRSVDDAIALYAGVDLHIGSRLHAHLLCLSRAIRSWLVPVDGRSVGIARDLGFPLCAPPALAAAMTMDFELVRERARARHAEMVRFLASLPR